MNRVPRATVFDLASRTWQRQRTPEDRRAEYAAARSAHGDEIDKVLEWAGVVASGAGIAMEGAFPLLQE